MGFKDWLKEFREEKTETPKQTTATTSSASNTSASASTGSGSFRDTLKEFREQKSASSIQGWSQVSNDLLSEVQQYYGTFKKSDNERYTGFQDRASSLLAQADAYRKQYAGNEQAISYIDSVVSSLSELKSYAYSYNNYYSKFEDEEQYNTALRQYGYQQKYKGSTFREIESALSTMADGEEKDWLKNYKYDMYKGAEDFDTKSASGWSRYEADQKASANKQEDEDLSWLEKLGKYLYEGGVSDTTMPLGNTAQIIHSLREDTSWQRPTDKWNDEQRDMYGYLYENNREEAYNYARLTSNKINQAELDEKIEAIENWSTQSGLHMTAATLGAIASMPLSLADTMAAMTEYQARGFITTSNTVTPTVLHDSAISAISNALNEKSGTLDEDLFIIGGKGLGDVYQLGTSIASSMLSAYTMGTVGTYMVFFGSAAASGINDAKERGATDGQAIKYGVALGLAEAAAEAFSVEKLLSREITGTTLKAFLFNVMQQAGFEGAEEGVTTFLNNLAEQFIMKDLSTFNVSVNYYMSKGMSEKDAKTKAWMDHIGELIYSGLAGAVSGGVSGGLSTGVQNIFINDYSEREYSGIQDELIAKTLENNPNNEFAQKMQAKSGKGKWLSGAQLNELMIQNEDTMNEQDTEVIRSTAEARLTELGETGDVNAIATVLAKQTSLDEVAGEKLSYKERQVIKNSKYGQQVADELKQSKIKPGETFSKFEKSIRVESLKKKLSKVAEPGKEVSASEQIAKAAGLNRERPTATNVSESGKTTLTTGDEVEVESISSAGNGKMTVRLKDGRVVSGDSLLHASGDTATVFNTVARIASTTGNANTIMQGFESSGMSAKAYVRGVELAHLYGKTGVPIADLRNSTAWNLSEDVRMAAYKSGQKAGGKGVAVAQSIVKSGKKTAVKTGIQMIGKDGKAQSFREYMQAEGKTLNARQEAGLITAEILNEAYGVSFRFYESYRNEEGHLEWVNENGQKAPAPNGMYRDGGIIYVDLNAGANTKDTLVLYTEGHELTHFIREWSPAKFEVLKKAVFKQLEAHGKNVDELIAKQIEKADRVHREISPEDAAEEVVADAMEGILADGKVMQQVMADIKTQDQSLWDKIVNWLKDAIAKLKSLVDAYSDVKPDSAEGQAVADMKDAIGVLEQLYADALKDAGNTFKSASTEVDVAIDTETESVAPTMFSERTWTDSDYVQARDEAAKEIAKAINVSVKKAKEYIDDVNSIAKMIAEDRTRLDYFSSPGRSSFVSNVEYGGSFDFSTLCKKRRLLTGTFSAIQRALPNTALTVDEILEIRNKMKDAGLEVSCGLCYVEGSRANMGKFAQEFLKLYKKYYPDNWQPNMADVNTPDGIEWVRINHPECYEQYEYFWNHYGTLKPGDKNLFASQQKPKLYQLRTEYKGEILQKFNDDENVEAKNLNGGIRLQSFSDFEIVHLIDTMQIIMDMSRVGLAGQAYTKVPEFAWALGDTGLKINLSLIAKGVDADGNLIFDDVEGMPIADAMALRDRYSKNVGTILVAFNDAQLLAAMKDDRVDYIIPFHRSQWKKSHYSAMGLPKNTKDYTYMQNEKFIKPQYHEYRGRMVQDKPTNYMPNEYWDFSKSGKENAEAYLEMCARNNKRPKFYKLLENNGDGSYSLKADGSTDGYWKLLIDFKMYDNDGVGSPQTAVKPVFNMDKATEMLNEYRGGHQNFPVAQGIVDEFVQQYKEKHKGEKFSARDSDSIEDMRSRISELDNRSRELQTQATKLLDSPEYKQLFDAVLDTEGEEHTKAMAAFSEWITSSGYGALNEEMSAIDEELKALRRKVDSAEKEAAKDAKTAYRAKYSEEFAKKYASKAARHFGTTSRFDLAGYLTVNGSLLDFSEGQGYRVQDHREVAEVLDFLPYNHGYSDGLIEFMNLGNIRLQSYGIDISKAPNAGQKTKLRQFFRNLNGEVVVDISDENGYTVGSLQYDRGTRPDRILNDIDTYFKTGEIPQQSDVAKFHTMYSDRVLMGSLFSGGGTLEAGLVYQMVDKEFAVEYNEKIASVYTDNHGKEHMFVGDVRDFDSKKKDNVFYLHASPVCKNYSAAKKSGGETTLDIVTAEATARVLEEQMPPVFTLENVKRYRNSEAFKLITDKLDELGYKWDVDVYNSAHYGAATARERLIVRAVKDGELPVKPKKTGFTTWYETVEDLINDLPEAPMPNWMKLRYDAGNYRTDMPLFILSGNKGGGLVAAYADKPAPTLLASSHDARIVMPDGRVLKATPRVMARIQGLPDDYKLPKQTTRAYTVIGNGIPTQLTKAVMGGVLDSAYEQTHGKVLYSDRETAPTFYSHMAKVIDGVKQEKLGAASVVSMLRGKGVKQEEIKWSGIEEFLAGKKSVTKAELQEFVAGSMLEIEEETLSDDELPMSKEDKEQIAKYEAERDIVAEELKSEWKRLIGTDIPITYFGAGLESAVVTKLLDANATVKENTEVGYQYKAKKAALKRVIEDNDDYFGYDNSKQAFMAAARNPVDFMNAMEMTSFEKGVFKDFIKAKEAYQKLEGIPIQNQKALKAIAESADRISARISNIKSAHYAKQAEHMTKWGQYKLKGGKNYREILFKLPYSTYSNDAMYTHWKERNGVLVHARIQDFDTSDGKMLFVEELQSDWHNEGQKIGYGDKGSALERWQEEHKKRSIEFEKLDAKLNEYNIRTNEYGEYIEDYDDVYLAYTDAASRLEESEQQLRRIKRGEIDLAPHAPFSDTYHEFVMKRLLREAAEKGYDSIGWTPAEIQVKRWSEKFIKAYTNEYDKKIPSFMRKFGKKFGATVGRTELPGMDIESKYYDVNRQEEFDSLAEWKDEVKRELRSQGAPMREIAFKQEGNDWVCYNKKTFDEYDRLTESKTSGTVWSMPITDSMRESVLYEGQPMYSDRDPLTDQEVLKRASEGLEIDDLTDAEREALNLFKKRMSRLEALQAQRKNLGEQYRKERFTKEGDKDKAEEIHKRMTEVDRQIDKARDDVLKVEQAEVLRRVLKDARKIVETEERKRVYAKAKERFDKKEAKIRQEYADRREAVRENTKDRKLKSELRKKIRKTVRELDKLLTKGTKERNVKEDLKELVTSTLKSAEILFTDELTDDDLLRNGIETQMTDEEKKHLAEAMKLFNKLQSFYKDPSVYDNMDDVKKDENRLAYRKTQLKNVFIRERSRLNEAKVSDVLNELADAYAKLKSSDKNYISESYNDVIHQYILWTKEQIGGTLIKDMTSDQLGEINKIYTMVLTIVRDANKMFNKDLKESREQLAIQAINEVYQTGGEHDMVMKALKGIKTFDWNNQKPIYAFERIGSKTLMRLFKNIRKGEDKWYVNINEANDFRKAVQKKYNFDSWDTEKQFTFTSETGTEFKLSVEQMMSLYAYSKREQAHSHLLKGGFVFDKNTEVIVDKKGVKVTYLMNTARTHALNFDILKEVISKLTAEQIGYVDEMQEYLSTTMGNKGNEVSMQLFGVKLFGEKYYFPLRSAGEYLAKAEADNLKKQQGQVNLVNSGFTKMITPEASNPVVLSNFSDVWSDHVNEMSMYNAFVLPLEDFRKVWNYSTPSSEGSPISVKGTTQNAYGDAAVNYITQLIMDLNGGALSDNRETFAKRMTGMFKKAAVFASLSVVVQQPMSIARAFAEIDPKYFLGEKMTSRKHKEAWEELKKYAPVAGIKEMGYFDTGMGMSARDFLSSKEYDGFKEKAKALVTDEAYRDELLGKAPALADELAWCAIWSAVKRETKASNKDLDINSEEFMQLCGERFTDIITKTQVYDSVLARSANMRSKTAYMNMATSFMAEPTTTLNMVENAVLKLKRGDKKSAVRTLAAVYTSIVLTSAAVSLVYAMRDDDEDESFLEKYISSFAVEMVDSLNPLTYIPFVKDLWSIAQGYDVERADMALWSKLISNMNNIEKLRTKDTSNMSEEALDEHNKKLRDAYLGMLDYMSALLGLPVKNIRRDMNAAVNVIKMMGKDIDTTWGSLVDKTWDSVNNTLPVFIRKPAETTQDKLYKAIVSGDKVYAERLMGTYKNQNAVDSALRKALRDNDPRIREAAIAWNAGNHAEYMKIAKSVIAEKNFSQDNIVKAITSEADALAPGEATESKTKHVGLFNMDAFSDSVRRGNFSMMDTIKAEVVDTHIKNGKTRDEAVKSYYQSAKSEVKDLLMDGEISEQTAIKALTNYCNLEEQDAKADVQYWTFTKKYPDVYADDAWFDKYYEEVESSGLGIDVYMDYRSQVKDITGTGKKQRRMDIINSLPITYAQKDALYFAEGWAASTIDEAPWH